MLSDWRERKLGREGLFPDRMRDDPANRKWLARSKMRAARRVRREAMRRGYSLALVHLTVNLSGELYDALSHEAARVELRRLLSGFPAYYVLARGPRAGRLHAHLIVPADLLQDLDVQDLDVKAELVRPERGGLSGLTKYLSKPNDEQAAKLKYRRNPSRMDKAAASERFLTAQADRRACGYSRLPVCSGLLNVPQNRRKATAPAPGLLLACLLTVLRLDAERAARLRERRGLILAHRKSQARRQPLPAPRVQTVCRWPAAGLPVRHAVPLLIGHARPPPMA